MPLPEIKHCVICDDARFEIYQKISLMGIYGSTPDAAIKVDNFSLPVRLCFAFFGGPGDGLATFRCQLKGRLGIPLIATSIPPQVDVRSSPQFYSTAIAFWFNAIFPGPQQYSVELTCNMRSSYTGAFKLTPASAPATVPPGLLPPPKLSFG
jgi:hypothetical protein